MRINDRYGVLLAMGFLFLMMPAVLRCEEELKGMKKIIKSISFSDAPIADVLTLLSEESGLSFTSTKEVKGKVSVELSNVSVQTVLDVVLENNGWKYTPSTDNKIIQVMTKAQYDEVYKTEKSANTVETVEFLPRHVPLDELTDAFRSVLTSEGKLIPVRTSKKLIVMDTPETIVQLNKLYPMIDIAPGGVVQTGLDKYIDTISVTNAPISDVLTLLSKESEIAFRSADGMQEKVTVMMSHTSVGAILNSMCNQYGWAYVAIPQSKFVKIMPRRDCDEFIGKFNSGGTPLDDVPFAEGWKIRAMSQNKANITDSNGKAFWVSEGQEYFGVLIKKFNLKEKKILVEYIPDGKGRTREVSK